MTRFSLRPEIHVPWTGLAAFAVLVYVVRSWLRGWVFVPDAGDLIVFGAFAAILVVREIARHLADDGEEPQDR